MSQGNPSYLRFSLEESVWFQKGQEVTELVSISLDPNITINESDQYVTIKGSLELSGEYNREDNEIDEELDFFTNPKLVQSVEVREEGVHLFSHHFPVEVTIPKNRIQSVDDIDVAVETFDYAFPEISCLRLSADLMITGLYGEQQHDLVQERIDEEDEGLFEYTLDPVFSDQEDEENVEKNVDELLEARLREQAEPVGEEISAGTFPFSKPTFDDESSEFYMPFEAEARKEPKAEGQNQERNDEDEQTEVYPEENIQVESWYQQERDAVAAEELILQEIEEQIEEHQKAVPQVFFTGKRNEGTKPPAPVASVESVNKVEEVSNYVEEPVEVNEVEESESSSSPEKKVKKKGSKWKNKQSLTLSEFLARKEEESHTRLKVCIVQKGDTLNELSERYDVTVSHLQKVNHLELNQDVYEGQVLYIPIAQRQR